MAQDGELPKSLEDVKDLHADSFTAPASGTKLVDPNYGKQASGADRSANYPVSGPTSRLQPSESCDTACRFLTAGGLSTLIEKNLPSAPAQVPNF